VDEVIGKYGRGQTDRQTDGRTNGQATHIPAAIVAGDLSALVQLAVEYVELGLDVSTHFHRHLALGRRFVDLVPSVLQLLQSTRDATAYYVFKLKFHRTDTDTDLSVRDASIV